jgi:hypothetical protein
MTLKIPFAIALVALSVSGCVAGRRCLFIEPLKSSLTGRLHFRDFSAPDGVDHVPVLALDQTVYVYAPAHSHSCLPVNDVQLVGWSEFPPDIAEGAHIVVDGSLFEAASPHQHTGFLINVNTIVPVGGIGKPVPDAH